ncbi:hypothetical protein EX30DRAFT_371460 [Ascodesmis nigricans]|uniref:C2H2-type domain-containing protein n=1 Tax=Ascodesmis nigricans TaxID=341454 RepID=A0A4S2MXN6_9PEZI|nr:hypothetical protein EX30DRAFT_371460 [Ascodesmis nigricans]
MTTAGYADGERGRDREREEQPDTPMGGGGDGGGGQSATTPTTSGRKRRRSRKGMEKKFDCPHPGCGKFYSRAEHLYRHQLNHTPKEIYFCDFPDCKRSFVRQDLCTRHRERHTNRGSHLQRRDSFLNANNPSPAGVNSVMQAQRPPIPKESSSSPETMEVKKEDFSGMPIPNAHQRRPSSTMSPETRPAIDPMTHEAKFQRTGNEGGVPQRRPSVVSQDGQYKLNRAQSFDGNSPHHTNIQPLNIPSATGKLMNRPMATTPTGNLQNLTLHSPYPHTPSTATPIPSNQTPMSSHTGVPIPTTTSQAYGNQNYQNFSLPQPAYPQQTHPPTTVSQNGFMTAGTTTASVDQTIAAVTSATLSDGWDPMSVQVSIPVFGETYSRSPQFNQIHSDFLELLIGGGDGQVFGQVGTLEQNPYLGNPLDHSPYGMPGQMQGPFFGQPVNNHPMNINTIAPPSPPRETVLSEDTRDRLIFAMDQFNEISNLFPGGIAPGSEDRHPLSLTSMQLYISLYWVHFHPQLPILHRPTFSTAKQPEVLVLCIMVIGMACMNFKQDRQLAQEAGDLANIITRNLRWAIFADNDFRPPAKLWVLQALLLLETYEKMYSDRRLHERAHIHHATTLTLMRRGSSLTGGRSGAYDSPQSGKDASDGGSATPYNGQSGGDVKTNEQKWEQWISTEATKRVAFAAFVVDSTHATMFGHSAVMVAHEIRLNLPCEESLWAAASANEFFSIHQSLVQNNIRQTTFLDALRFTLTGKPVHTNAFGRTILMAGLLSVGWHLHQRDMQIMSLGVTGSLGGKEKWRATITHAFDYWKKDFDQSLAKLQSHNFSGTPFYAQPTDDLDHETTFESRTVLHHLAHMSMHVSIVDLQIYAGARRLLGRSITLPDAEAVKKKMAAWAPTARARDAAFYALRFLGQVLLPEEPVELNFNVDGHDTARRGSGAGGAHSQPQTTGNPVYSARDDHLLNQPWVLYYASLVVWSYGFALEGALRKPVAIPTTPQESYIAMRRFLRTVGGVKSPEELGMLHGKNECLGLLLTLQGMFANCRWELLLEASKLLANCVKITLGEVGG